MLAAWVANHKMTFDTLEALQWAGFDLICNLNWLNVNHFLNQKETQKLNQIMNERVLHERLFDLF